ncbi:MAG: hypothetical protein ACLVFN_02590 [Enterocloster sp.]
MAVIEVCDICRKEVSKTDGLTVKASEELFKPASTYKREFDIRICNCCKENIIKYCRKYRK